MEDNKNLESKLEEGMSESDLFSGAIEAVKLLFSQKPLAAFEYVKKSKVPLGCVLASLYVLVMAVASVYVGAAPIRVINETLGVFVHIDIPYGDLFVRGFTFGAVSLVAFVVALHLYFVLAKKSVTIQSTINFVSVALTPVTLLGVVVFIASFINVGFATTLLMTSSLIGVMLLIGGLPKFLNDTFKLTWLLIGCLAVAQLITFALLNWVIILGTLSALF